LSGFADEQDGERTNADGIAARRGSEPASTKSRSGLRSQVNYRSRAMPSSGLTKKPETTLSKLSQSDTPLDRFQPLARLCRMAEARRGSLIAEYGVIRTEGLGHLYYTCLFSLDVGDVDPIGIWHRRLVMMAQRT
jgi:hypothetical protein